MMAKWATAYMTTDGNNTIKIVEAENEIEAICKGVGEADGTSSRFESAEEAIMYYFDGDINVAMPVKIE